jgi:hypothetical protein
MIRSVMSSSQNACTVCSTSDSAGIMNSTRLPFERRAGRRQPLRGPFFQNRIVALAALSLPDTENG